MATLGKADPDFSRAILQIASQTTVPANSTNVSTVSVITRPQMSSQNVAIAERPLTSRGRLGGLL